jgi:PAS domain S-box-containing protein
MKSARLKTEKPKIKKVKVSMTPDMEYRILFERHPYPMWVFDRSTERFLAVNEAATCKYGFSRKEFLEMSIMDIRPPDQAPILRKHLTQRMAKSPTPPAYSLGIWKHWTKKHILMDVSIYSSLITFRGKRAILVLAHDVTEQLRAEQALSESQARLRESEACFRSVFDFAPIGMGLLDLKGNIVQVNRAMCEMMGYTEAEYLKLSMNDVTHPEDVDRSAELMRGTMRGEMKYFEQEKRYIHKSGRVIWALLRGTVIRDANDQPKYGLGLVQDITLRKHAEMERESMIKELEGSRNSLQRLSRRLVEVQEAERRRIALELHDQIGQELTALKLNLERCRESCAKEEQGTPLAESHARVSRLLSMVRDLSLDLRPTMLDDLGLLHALLWYLDRFKTGTGIAVQFKHRGIGHRRFSPETETAAFRIVQEALTNVARHSQSKEVRIWLWASKERLALSIEDQGVGFDAEAVARAGASTGLSGMRERAALLGGNLSFDSAPGRGTSLTATLPLQDKAGEQVTL